MKLPITTITVSCDEGHLLDECLSTLSFCAERIVVDMASTDQTAQVAATHQVRYLFSKRYPVIEYVRAQLLTEARHDWVLFVDPDERIPPLLQTDLLALFEQKKLDKVGIVELPWQFFFKQRALRGTVWGGERYKKSLLHRERVVMTNFVHRGIEVQPNYTIHRLPFRSEHAIIHRWMTGCQQLIRKHQRYLKEEGRSQYEQGQRYTRGRQIRATLYAFKHCFYTKKGYLDAWLGLSLSVFWLWYVFSRWQALKRYEQTLTGAD